MSLTFPVLLDVPVQRDVVTDSSYVNRILLLIFRGFLLFAIHFSIKKKWNTI